MGKFSDSPMQLQQRNLHAHAIRIREIFLAYFGIFLIESARLFPAVWVR